MISIQDQEDRDFWLGAEDTGLLQMRLEAERDAASNAAEYAAREEGGLTMKKRTLKHRLPDGTVATRRTAREYTHVVIVTWTGSPKVASWHMTEAAARKQLTRGTSPECWVEKVNGGE